MNKLILGLVILFSSSMVLAAGDAQAGKTKAIVCGACHGADGNSSIANYPRLAGQHASYILKELHDIKGGARNVLEMTGIVANMTEQDFEDVAAYFSSQTMQGGTTDPKLLTKGEALYRGGNLKLNIPACSGCHGPDGLGNESAKYPRLAGQHAEYIEKQLKAFRLGFDQPTAKDARTNDGDAQIMRDVAAHLSDLDIHSVASFIAGLRPAK